jgi:hypothetical protein
MLFFQIFLIYLITPIYPSEKCYYIIIIIVITISFMQGIYTYSPETNNVPIIIIIIIIIIIVIYCN